MRRAILLVTMCSTGLWACGDNPPPATTTVKAPAPAPAPKPDAAATATSDAPSFVYAYIPSGKRDPFRSPLEEMAGKPGDTIQAACNAPLCHWDLDQLRLVGVVSGMSNPVAMVEDPEGVGYVVRRNSFVGKKGGRVTQIKHDSMIVTEIVRGGDGKPHPNDIPLRLAADAEGAGDKDLLEGEGSE